jgi:hypothetical protein
VQNNLRGQGTYSTIKFEGSRLEGGWKRSKENLGTVMRYLGSICGPSER